MRFSRSEKAKMITVTNEYMDTDELCEKVAELLKRIEMYDTEDEKKFATWFLFTNLGRHVSYRDRSHRRVNA